MAAHGDGSWCAPESVGCTTGLGKPMVVSVFDLRWQGRELGWLEINGPFFAKEVLHWVFAKGQHLGCTTGGGRASTGCVQSLLLPASFPLQTPFLSCSAGKDTG